MSTRTMVVAIVIGVTLFVLATLWSVTEKGMSASTHVVTTGTSSTTVTTTTSTLPPPPPSTTTPSTSMPRPHTTAPMVRPADGSVWDRLASCESNGRWHIFDSLHSGGLQFAYATWRQAGGTRFASMPHLASREQQIQIAKEWLRRTSPRQWPVCGPRVGLTMADAA
jgi:hypothetical protein